MLGTNLDAVGTVRQDKFDNNARKNLFSTYDRVAVL